MESYLVGAVRVVWEGVVWVGGGCWFAAGEGWACSSELGSGACSGLLLRAGLWLPQPNGDTAPQGQHGWLLLQALDSTSTLGCSPVPCPAAPPDNNLTVNAMCMVSAKYAQAGPNVSCWLAGWLPSFLVACLLACCGPAAS